MSSKSRKKRKLWKYVLLAVIVAAVGSAWITYSKNIGGKEAELSFYKEETVGYGAVTYGFSESGTASLGSLEQTFTVGEITEVSTASDSETDSSSGASGTQAENQTGSQGTQAMGQGTQSSTGGMTQAGTGAVSSSETLSLEVEEVYVAAGQIVEAGEPILKITEASMEEYREQLEAAVENAQLNVAKEEINVESKRAEADYTYQMYLAKGETAQETYDATITALENEVSDLEEELEESGEAVAELELELSYGYDVEEDLEEEQLNYSTIESNLQIAKNNLTTQSIEAKQTYEDTMTNYQYAQQLYEIDTNGLEDDLEEAKDTLEEAQEALAEFVAQIGDGIVYGEYGGTITAVSYVPGDNLINEGTLVTFADSGNVTMVVSVSQEDIVSIAIGDQAAIALTAYEDQVFKGEISAISTSTETGSATVNYDVTVLFTGDVSKVYAGMTGEVTFAEKTLEDTIYISNKAVHQDGTRSWVKVRKEDGTIEERDIKTTFSNGITVGVESGLSQGEIILIESQVTE